MHIVGHIVGAVGCKAAASLDIATLHNNSVFFFMVTVEYDNGEIETVKPSSCGLLDMC